MPKNGNLAGTLRGLQGKVRREESLELAQDLRRVYKAHSKAEAEKALDAVLEKWGKKYPSVKRTLLEAAEKLVYLVCLKINEGFQKRRLRRWVSWEREKLTGPLSKLNMSIEVKVKRLGKKYCG